MSADAEIAYSAPSAPRFRNSRGIIFGAPNLIVTMLTAAIAAIADTTADAITHSSAVARCNTNNIAPAVNVRAKEVSRFSVAVILIFSNV